MFVSRLIEEISGPRSGNIGPIHTRLHASHVALGDQRAKGSGRHLVNLRSRQSSKNTFMWQNNSDRRANIDLALDRKRTAMQFNEMLGEWKAKSRARILTADLAVDLAELFQGFGDFLRGHPDSRIAYGYCQAGIRRKARHANFSARSRKLHGIGQEIDEDLAYTPVIGAYQRNILIDRFGQLNPGLFSLRSDQTHARFYRLADVDIFLV